MSNANMGLKRQCLSCGGKFYDLAKDPILCPKCGATFEPVLLARSPPRRAGRVFSTNSGPFEARAETAVETGAEKEAEETDENENETEENAALLDEDADRRAKIPPAVNPGRRNRFAACSAQNKAEALLRAI